MTRKIVKALGDRLQAQPTGIPQTPDSSALQPWCTGEVSPMTLRSLLDVVKNSSVGDAELEISWMNDVRHSSVRDSEHLTITKTVRAVWVRHSSVRDSELPLLTIWYSLHDKFTRNPNTQSAATVRSAVRGTSWGTAMSAVGSTGGSQNYRLEHSHERSQKHKFGHSHERSQNHRLRHERSQRHRLQHSHDRSQKHRLQ